MFVFGCVTILFGCETNLLPTLPRMAANPMRGGIIVADEPQAVLIARDILYSGGSAADAAAALGFGLSVTLQSSAGLGGGGICLVYDSKTTRTEILDFKPQPAIGRQISARWQVSVPTLARGLFALHAKYGRLSWQQIVMPAENLVRFDNKVSRALARHLSRAPAALTNDPKTLDLFLSSNRTVVMEGDLLQQFELAATFGRIRARTPGDLYVGALAIALDRSAEVSGTSLSASDLRKYIPIWKSAQPEKIGSVAVYSSVAFENAEALVNELHGKQRGDAVPPSATSAGTGFVVADTDGNVVACTLTMVHPFGVGLIPSGLGFLLAPSPESEGLSSPPLIVGIVIDQTSRQMIYAGATAGEGAAKLMGSSIRQVIVEGTRFVDSFAESNDNKSYARPLINSVYCNRGLETGFRSCAVRSDPAGYGYGVLDSGGR
jgi:gamma-glutamyltranspeptidase / glutathione hydrolase